MSPWRARVCHHDRPMISGFSARSPRAGVARYTTKLETAHSTEFRELLYPWHPWSGLRVGLHKEVERPGGAVFRCDLKASVSDRWLEIPAWMFDRASCAMVRLEAEPHTSLAALVGLAALLRHASNKDAAASAEAISGVSPLSGNWNRGEAHAKPEQAEVSRLQRTTADRPIRGERREGEDARLVRITGGDAGGTDWPDDAVDLGSRQQAADRDGGRS